MSGFPVVIAENGLGLPVVPVDDGAPVASVSEHGGLPIVIASSGVPLILIGYTPPDDP